MLQQLLHQLQGPRPVSHTLGTGFCMAHVSYIADTGSMREMPTQRIAVVDILPSLLVILWWWFVYSPLLKLADRTHRPPQSCPASACRRTWQALVWHLTAWRRHSHTSQEARTTLRLPELVAWCVFGGVSGRHCSSGPVCGLTGLWAWMTAFLKGGLLQQRKLGNQTLLILAICVTNAGGVVGRAAADGAGGGAGAPLQRRRRPHRAAVAAGRRRHHRRHQVRGGTERTHCTIMLQWACQRLLSSAKQSPFDSSGQ